MCYFLCYFFLFLFTLFFFVLLENFQEYQEEFRDISGKSTKKLTGGSIADGNITLINQRHVGDDLPVISKSPQDEWTKFILILIIHFDVPWEIFNGFGNNVFLTLIFLTLFFAFKKPPEFITKSRFNRGYRHCSVIHIWYT